MVALSLYPALSLNRIVMLIIDNDGYYCGDIDDNDAKMTKILLSSVQSAGVLWSSDTLVEFTSNESGFRCLAQKLSLLSHKSWHCLITFNKYTSSSLKVDQICWPEKSCQTIWISNKARNKNQCKYALFHCKKICSRCTNKSTNKIKTNWRQFIPILIGRSLYFL